MLLLAVSFLEKSYHNGWELNDCRLALEVFGRAKDFLDFSLSLSLSSYIMFFKLQVSKKSKFKIYCDYGMRLMAKREVYVTI